MSFNVLKFVFFFFFYGFLGLIFKNSFWSPPGIHCGDECKVRGVIATPCSQHEGLRFISPIPLWAPCSSGLPRARQKEEVQAGDVAFWKQGINYWASIWLPLTIWLEVLDVLGGFNLSQHVYIDKWLKIP